MVEFFQKTRGSESSNVSYRADMPWLWRNQKQSRAV